MNYMDFLVETCKAQREQFKAEQRDPLDTNAFIFAQLFGQVVAAQSNVQQLAESVAAPVAHEVNPDEEGA